MPPTDPLDPPRRRANKRPGHGTWDNDRPPVCGVMGRESGEVRLSVERHSDSATLNRVAREATRPPARVPTDERGGSNRLAETGCSRASVCHAAGEWARDDDGDGVREVHCNTQEGIWTHVRTFLRRFYGVSKWYLAQYEAVFQWGYNIKTVTDEFLRILLGIPPSTDSAP